VPLRDIREYHLWVEREGPSLEAQRVVRYFIAEIGDEPWRAPSVPIAELSNQPEYEVRAAALDPPGGLTIRVWYRHLSATGAVDVSP
jgi:hypothetical protein